MNQEISILRGLQLLNETIKTGSFSKTADKLRLQQSNVSKTVRDFEKIIGVKLFSKSAHGVSPTHECLEIQKLAYEMENLFNKVKNFTISTHDIIGEIKIWTTDGIGCYLIPYLVEFQNRYPEINYRVICSNEMPKFGTREADLAIVYSKPKVYEPIKYNSYAVKFGLFASSSYVARYGIPKDFDDLIKNHKICDRKEYSNIWENWRDIVGQSRYVVSYFDTTSMLIQATKEGMGIALHPTSYGKIENDFVYIDLGLELEHTCWLVYHHDDENTPKIKLLRNSLEDGMLLLCK